jgi:hypothetical protein
MSLNKRLINTGGAGGGVGSMQLITFRDYDSAYAVPFRLRIQQNIGGVWTTIYDLNPALGINYYYVYDVPKGEPLRAWMQVDGFAYCTDVQSRIMKSFDGTDIVLSNIANWQNASTYYYKYEYACNCCSLRNYYMYFSLG